MTAKPRPASLYVLNAVTNTGDRVLVDVFTTRKAADEALAALDRAEAVHGRIPTVARYAVSLRLPAGR